MHANRVIDISMCILLMRKSMHACMRACMHACTHIYNEVSMRIYELICLGAFHPSHPGVGFSEEMAEAGRQLRFPRKTYLIVCRNQAGSARARVTFQVYIYIYIYYIYMHIYMYISTIYIYI